MSGKNTYKANEQVYIETWAQHVSSKQLVKFLPRVKSQLHEVLNGTSEGILCLKYMHKINKTFKSRDNSMFVSTIDMFGRYLEKHPTLIPYFPLSLLKNMKRIRKKCKKRSLNVIYLTRHHKLTCAGCKSKVVGNKCESRSCACSTRFYHKSCYTVLKCDVCGM